MTAGRSNLKHDFPTPQVRESQNIYIHPQYIARFMSNDFCVIELKSAFNPSEWVSIVKLPKKRKPGKVFNFLNIILCQIYLSYSSFQ